MFTKNASIPDTFRPAFTAESIPALKAVLDHARGGTVKSLDVPAAYAITRSDGSVQLRIPVELLPEDAGVVAVLLTNCAYVQVWFRDKMLVSSVVSTLPHITTPTPWFSDHAPCTHAACDSLTFVCSPITPGLEVSLSIRYKCFTGLDAGLAKIPVHVLFETPGKPLATMIYDKSDIVWIPRK